MSQSLFDLVVEEDHKGMEDELESYKEQAKEACMCPNDVCSVWGRCHSVVVTVESHSIHPSLLPIIATHLLYTLYDEGGKIVSFEHSINFTRVQDVLIRRFSSAVIQN